MSDKVTFILDALCLFVLKYCMIDVILIATKIFNYLRDMHDGVEITRMILGFCSIVFLYLKKMATIYFPFQMNS